MKSKYIFTILLQTLFFTNKIFSEDIDFTVTHITDLNVGSIVVNIGNGFQPPFTMTITGPNTNSTIIENSNSHAFSISQQGEYCIAIENGSGCSATGCMFVRKCNITKWGSIICYEEPTEIPTDVFALGSKNSTQLNLSAKDFDYRIISPPNLNTSSKELINNKIEIFTNQLLSTGYSQYLTDTQNEIQFEGDFIFKFNTEGDIIWIFCKNFCQSNESIDEDMNLESYSSSITNENTTKGLLFPNPTFGQIQINNKNKFIDYEIYNMYGSLLDKGKFEDGRLKLTHNGINIIRIKIDGIFKTEKVIKLD